jgi:predicted nucleic acid-binding protein
VADRHPRGVLDTSVVIDLPDIPDENLPVAATITAVTLAELSQGPHLASSDVDRANRTERLQIAERAYRAPLPFDAAAARRYGTFVALVLAAGRHRRPRRLDLMIAAITAVNALPLYTRNLDDFAGLEDSLVLVAA